MALATVRDLSFAYSDGGEALSGVSLDVDAGEVVLLCGRSGSGKTTLLRALAGLVPHFHGGRFAGLVQVAGRDTRRTRPAELASTVATLFQDPEDQVVFAGVDAEVAFGLENAGVAPGEIAGRARRALASVGAEHLRGREVAHLSGGELQRVCLASVLAVEPALLLLDEPTSQLDDEGSRVLVDLVRRRARELGNAVVLGEQRLSKPLEVCDRVVVLDRGAIVFDGSPGEARRRLEHHPPVPRLAAPGERSEELCAVEAVSFAYPGGEAVLTGATLVLRRGEVVALVGPNGVGKTTLAKIAAGLLQPGSGRVTRPARAAYLCQDPGRYVACERCDEEVALGAQGGAAAAGRALEAVGLAGFEGRHPRDLSSGERERLALAAVLATDADVLVLDEPTRGLDPDGRSALAALLRGRAREAAILLVTHDQDLVAAVADRIVELGARAEEGDTLAA